MGGKNQVETAEMKWGLNKYNNYNLKWQHVKIDWDWTKNGPLENAIRSFTFLRLIINFCCMIVFKLAVIKVMFYDSLIIAQVIW